MTLYELGEDYLRQNDIIVDKIHYYNKELKTKKGNDYIVLKRNIMLYYQMSRELRDTAYTLMHYYDKSDRRVYRRKRITDYSD
jgi:phage pi2 protein 07